jgi:hypothetical protein
MASKQQMTGMHGVYLVAAELTNRGYIVSPTSRAAYGADLLVTDQHCRKAWSVQVKTNRKAASFWLLNARARETTSPSHVYVFVNMRGDHRPDYYVVPSRTVAKKMRVTPPGRSSTWYSFFRDSAKPHRERWEVFGNPA